MFGLSDGEMKGVKGKGKELKGGYGDVRKKDGKDDKVVG